MYQKVLDQILPITLSWEFQKRELQQTAINHSSNIEFKTMNLYKNGTVKVSFLLNDTTLASDNPLPFRGNPLERI